VIAFTDAAQKGRLVIKAGKKPVDVFAEMIDLEHAMREKARAALERLAPTAK
jgi:hypothetical protein